LSILEGKAGQQSKVNMTDTDAYQNDLAYIHDTGFGGFARSTAPNLLTLC